MLLWLVRTNHRAGGNNDPQYRESSTRRAKMAQRFEATWWALHWQRRFQPTVNAPCQNHYHILPSARFRLPPAAHHLFRAWGRLACDSNERPPSSANTVVTGSPSAGQHGPGHLAASGHPNGAPTVLHPRIRRGPGPCRWWSRDGWRPLPWFLHNLDDGNNYEEAFFGADSTASLTIRLANCSAPGLGS
jgi:hypothetical protein